MKTTDAPLTVGEAVVYKPHFAATAEDGVVSSLSSNPTMVFVRYADQSPDAAGKATYIADLERRTPKET